MKAYVIKNKEGKYLGKYSFDNENVISNARVFEFSFTAKELCPKDCTIVPITICEGDLEENRVLKKALELACEDISLYEDITTPKYKVKCYIQQAKEMMKDE